VGTLPRPNAYGVSVTTTTGVICAGGGDAKEHFTDVFRLSWRENRLHTETLPPLPQRCAFTSGTLVGETLYISGGIERPDATSCLRTFWALDLKQPKPAWKVLEPCPGAERMLAVAGASADRFFLFSGTRLKPDAEGKPVREYLRDAWEYRPEKGWRRLADLPRPTVAAPTPAMRTNKGKLLVFTGDDGTKVGYKPEPQHPGFPRDVLAYDLAADAWSVVGKTPFSRGTVTMTEWRGMHVIPSGEERPGYRSPEVWGVIYAVE
jgi:N-acetylneuraminate epimerase